MNTLDPAIFGQVLVRRNIIQNVDQKVDASGLITRSIYLQSTEAGLLQKNILAIRYVHPGMTAPSREIFQKCGLIKVFGDQTETGVPLEATDLTSGMPFQFTNTLWTNTELFTVIG